MTEPIWLEFLAQISGLWPPWHCPFFAEMVNTVASILKTGASINLYMFHGGTNFGFMNGALEADEYKSDVTSYGEFIVTALPVQLWVPWAGDSDQHNHIVLERWGGTKLRSKFLPKRISSSQPIPGSGGFPYSEL